MKIKAKAQDCKLIVKIKTAGSERIDEKELDRFSRVFLRGFFKPKLINKKLVEYSGPVGITLHERLRKPVSKRDFLFILEQLAVAIQKLQANNMFIYHMVLDTQYVYINEATKEMQFLYIPLSSGQKGTNLIEFIETIVYSAKPSGEGDTDFVSRFIYYFRGLKPFDISKVEDFVLKEDRSIVNTIRKQNAGQSGFMTNKQQHFYEHYDKNNAEDDDEATGLLSQQTDNSYMYSDDEATGLLVDESDEATGLLVDDDEGTALLTEDTYQVHYPTLQRVLTGEIININKPVFRLGKEKSYVDYFVTNNVAVSRSHADIITRSNQYYVIDLNSKNHTYINGQMIPVQYETQIHNGDRLKLANEEFVFCE